MQGGNGSDKGAARWIIEQCQPVQQVMNFTVVIVYHSELYGQYFFYGEHVARIVSKLIPVVSEGLTNLTQCLNQKSNPEFLAFYTTHLFRPVDMNAPLPMAH